MQNIFPVLCFIAGFALAWLVFRGRRGEEAAVFKALSSDALAHNNRAFLDLARSALAETQQAARHDLEMRQQSIAAMVTPVRASLEKVDSKIQDLEKARCGAYAALQEQVRSLIETQGQIRAETGRLVAALRTPGVRGHWGEMQLRRVVEMAGMLDHCDFAAQATFASDDVRIRPDLVVRMPAGKTIVVDAKTPLDAYLRAIDADDEQTRKLRFADHARQVRNQIAALARKSYWEQFDDAPEFAVLFLPGECFFSAALESDPSLIESGVDQNIILATPTTLIALLRAVAYGWRQEKLAQNAAEISALGRELYKRLSDLGDHWNRMGRSLERAVEAYNAATGSLEGRVMVSARRFAELKSAPLGVEIEELERVEKNVRAVCE
ncbi:MAG TPA: DNA recombination protein RmuC [Bryobacteraceae bacterium]|nr:DNA recombination protein RmuC [Bryobacteraceae bacterium]